ncbi:hypothetical protein DID88_006017 [Monilinia fructigena]|uniref:Uncharacterized protein n=1 Tax=Monilinia fructigena TaxID=38457 RepID=A0A395J2J1_9HELO|nr:hypothetical protein DID88_006017 [Monilinia fructigena]
MSLVRAKFRRFSKEEDANILGYREWSNGKVSESWSQFRARYDNKFWIDPRSSASLFQRAGRLSGQLYQILSQNEEMMQNMLTIRKSSLRWTWGRIGQAFDTNEIEDKKGGRRWEEGAMERSPPKSDAKIVKSSRSGGSQLDSSTSHSAKKESISEFELYLETTSHCPKRGEAVFPCPKWYRNIANTSGQ